MAKSSAVSSVKTLAQLLYFVRPYKSMVLAALVALVVTAGLTLGLGQGVRLVIDNGLIAQSSEQLTQSTLILSAIVIFLAVGTFVRFYLVSTLGERVSADIRTAVFNHLVRLHPSYFEENRSGDIMSRLTTDTTLLQSIIGSSLSMALRSSLTFIGGLIMLLITNIKLTAVVLGIVPIVLIPIFLFGKKIKNLSRKSQDSIANVGTYAGEIIQHIKVVQSYTREPYEQDAFAREVDNAFNISKQRITQRALMIATVITLVFTALIAMLWMGGQDVLAGNISGGELAAFVFYAIIVAMAVATISEVMGEIQRAAGAAERLIEMLNEPTEIANPADPIALPTQTQRAIAVTDLTFHYSSRPDKPALSNLHLDIAEKQVVALVGPSGAGKTTLFELLQRFYLPQSGQIAIYGIDISRLALSDLRKTIGWVPQQPVMFSTDVWHNIRYGNEQASDEAVIAAAKKAHAHEFIQDLPQGYSSFLGDNGVRLSGGQKQRLAIARAILKDPKILLLDEATSALDAESEFHVQAALSELMKNRTTIIIAHRLSTVMHADKIFVMDGGRVIDSGTHQQLTQTSPLYARLCKLQFRQPDSDTMTST